MVIHADEYRLATQEKRIFSPVLRAQQIAKSLLASMGYQDVGEQHPYFSQRDYRDPGEEFAWADGLAQWQVV